METVDLIASGYEWICPTCKYVINKEVEIPENDEVTCKKCKGKFKINPAEHAYA